MLVDTSPRWTGRLAAGLAGATTLTLLHQSLRLATPDAPRLDVLGRRALAAGLSHAGIAPPRGAALQRAALAGDLISNGLFYGLLVAGARRGALRRALGWGAAAGLGAVYLAPALGLGHRAAGRNERTRALTVGLYTAGALATVLAARFFRPRLP